MLCFSCSFSFSFHRHVPSHASGPSPRHTSPPSYAFCYSFCYAVCYFLAMLFTVLFAMCDGATDPTRVMEHAERSWKCRTNDNFHLWRYSKCKTILVWPDGTETTCDGATDPTRVMEHAESSWKCRTNDN